MALCKMLEPRYRHLRPAYTYPTYQLQQPRFRKNTSTPLLLADMRMTGRIVRL